MNKSLRQRQVRLIETRQQQVVKKSANNLFRVMRGAVDEVVDNWEKTGRYKQPDLSQIDEEFLRFYELLIRVAVSTSEQCKKMQNGKAKLNRMPWGIPKVINSPRDIFKNTKYWARVAKRAESASAKVRKKYQQKMKKLFDRIIPEIEQGNLTPNDVKREMVKAFDTSKARVETIFRTETTSYFGRAQIAYFEKDDEIIGFMFDSVRDSSRTDICRSRHGLIYRPGTKLLAENTPALHWNCRSQLIPLANTAENRKMLEDQARNPSKVKVVPLPRGWRVNAA